MNAINLDEPYKLLSLWTLWDGEWVLVDLDRSRNAIRRCRQHHDQNLYAFLPSFCPANAYANENHEQTVSKKPG